MERTNWRGSEIHCNGVANRIGMGLGWGTRKVRPTRPARVRLNREQQQAGKIQEEACDRGWVVTSYILGLSLECACPALWASHGSDGT